MMPFVVWLERQWHRADNVGWLSTWLFRFGDAVEYPAAPTTYSDWLELMGWAVAAFGEFGEGYEGRPQEVSRALARSWQEWRMELNGQPALTFGQRELAS